MVMNLMLISALQGKSQSDGQGKVKEPSANRVITCLYTYDEFMPTVLFIHTYSSRKQILWTVTMVHVLTALHFQLIRIGRIVTALPSYPCKILILHLHPQPQLISDSNIPRIIPAAELGQLYIIPMDTAINIPRQNSRLIRNNL